MSDSPPPPLPRFAQVEPIGRCNLACRMCTVNHRGDEVAEMPFERFAGLLDQMPGLEELHLQGLGEPMLHPRFFDMVALAAGRGIKVSTNTNLTLLTPDRARACVTGGLSSMSVSLDGASAPVYEAIRRRASFDKLLRNLRRLVDARDATDSRLEVRGVMVLMRSNLEELPALLHLLSAHRVYELLVQRLSHDLREPGLPRSYIPIRTFVDESELSAGDLPRAAEVFDQARVLARQLGIRLHLPRLGAAPANGQGRCRWPWEQLYITAAGELLPCCMVATADRAAFGSVFKPEGRMEAGLSVRWQGASAQAFRAALADGPPPGVCRSCALYHGSF